MFCSCCRRKHAEHMRDRLKQSGWRMMGTTQTDRKKHEVDRQRAHVNSCTSRLWDRNDNDTRPDLKCKNLSRHTVTSVIIVQNDNSSTALSTIRLRLFIDIAQFVNSLTQPPRNKRHARFCDKNQIHY